MDLDWAKVWHALPVEGWVTAQARA